MVAVAWTGTTTPFICSIEVIKTEICCVPSFPRLCQHHPGGYGITPLSPMGRVGLGQSKRLAGSLRPGKWQVLSFQHPSLQTPGAPGLSCLSPLGTAVRTIFPRAEASTNVR